jgi:PLP dependent protein
LTSLSARIEFIQTQIKETAIEAGRDPVKVHLLAVSKGQPVTCIQEAYTAGLSDFGENYWQEARQKIALLSTLHIHWHFLGGIQRNKIKHIAQHFDWVHSVRREIELTALSAARPVSLPDLQLCIEVQVPGSLGKEGVNQTDLPRLTKLAMQLPKVKLRGLMVILDPSCPVDSHQAVFEQVHVLLNELNQVHGCACDTLSMGMSGDFVAAIRAGSNWVRIGRGLFGSRDER